MTRIFVRERAMLLECKHCDGERCFLYKSSETAYEDWNTSLHERIKKTGQIRNFPLYLLPKKLEDIYGTKYFYIWITKFSTSRNQEFIDGFCKGSFCVVHYWPLK